MAGCFIANPDGSEQRGCWRLLPTPWSSLKASFPFSNKILRTSSGFFNLAGCPLPAELVEVEAISGSFMMLRRSAIAEVGAPASGLRQPGQAEDLAGAIEKVFSLPVTYRKIYNLGGGETLTYRQMVARIFTGFGKKERLITLPSGLFRWLLQMSCLFNNQLDISPAMVRRMNEHLCYDYEAAERDFNYQPRGFEG